MHADTGQIGIFSSWLLPRLLIAISDRTARRPGAGYGQAVIPPVPSTATARVMDELRWQNFLYDLLWIVPLAVSFVSVGFALLWQRCHTALSTVYLCFVLAVLVITLGVMGSWRGELELFVILGVAGDISAELLYKGWKRSWHPLYYSVIAVGALLLIATIAKRRGDRLSPTASAGYPAALPRRKAE